MATKNENTLQIKDFLGISRYYSSPNQPPNKFFAIQNLYTPNKGELANIGGVTAVGSAIPGSTGIVSASFLRTPNGISRYLAFFDHGALPTPAAPVLATTTGTNFTGTVQFFMTFVGMGGESLQSPLTSVVCGTGANIIFTPPTLPAGIVGINLFLYTQDNSTSGFDGDLIATVNQVNGAIPATITLRLSQTAATGTAYERRLTFSSFTITFQSVPSTDASLVPGMTYYVGIAPAYTGLDYSIVTTNVGLPTLPTVNGPAGRVIAFTVPSGMNQAEIEFVGVRAEMRETSGAYAWEADSSTLPPVYVLCGLTPNDLSFVGNADLGSGVLQGSYSSTNLTVAILEAPANTNCSSFVAWGGNDISLQEDYSDPYAFRQTRFCPSAQCFGYENNTLGSNTLGTEVLTPQGFSGLGLAAMLGIGYNSSTDYQIVPTRGATLFTKNGNTAFPAAEVFIPSPVGQFVADLGDGINEVSYVNQNYFVNNLQCPFYTNGYVMSPLCRQFNTPYLPITSAAAAFNGILALGGGESTLFNTQNVVYYSVAGDFTTFTQTPAATASLAFIGAIAGSSNNSAGDNDDIVGFGVYSESLSTTGITGFLVIGKQHSCFLWSGQATSGAQPIAINDGFASSKSFVVTPYGPIFVGHDNLYIMNQYGTVQPIGNDVKAIIQAIPDASLPFTNVVYNNLHVKIGYQTTANVDTELWLDLRNDDGQIVPVFTGPHVMTPYADQASSQVFAGVRNLRLSFLNNQIFQRDNLASYLDNGNPIPLYIETNDMGLGADDFLKDINQIYFRSKINRQETMSFNLLCYDNLSTGMGLDYVGPDETTFADTIVFPYAGSPGTGTTYRLFQKLISASRYRGSIIRAQFSWSTVYDFRIESLSFTYATIKRRRA